MARTKNFDESEVLDQAMDLFWSKGYNATSIQDLVAHLGINRASLYDTYGDKHQLFLRALRRYRDTMLGALTQKIKEDKPAKEIVKDLFVMTIRDSLADRLHKGCFMVNAAVELAPHDAEAESIVVQNSQDFEEAFRNVIARGQHTGEISTRHSPEALAKFIFNTVSGLRVAAKCSCRKNDLDDVVNVSLSVLDV